MLKNRDLTYISLFSSGGVGCYGFQMEGYHCIATNELIERRMDIQKYNHKCEDDSGYIVGDITLPEIKESIYQEIRAWAKKGNDRVDVLIATPPCQGISVINHKKNDHEIERNSLVVESIDIVKSIHPRFFLFENVMAFEKTYCITPDDNVVRIGDYIRDTLGEDYVITSKIINFMNYGSNSSRTRTLVIGVDKKYRNNIVPFDLFPQFREEKTLRQVIEKYPVLQWGEIDSNDFYHAFRTYDIKMRDWIHDLKEGESAFDNEDPMKRPHRIVNGEVVFNIRKNRDKYTRQKWDRFVQCIHTRNDQLAAQNTIHPNQDRVFSIRELMDMMTIPRSFKWVDMSVEALNELSEQEKRNVYRNNEVNIRQCIGEAVPTEIFRQIAASIKHNLYAKHGDPAAINKLISTGNFDEDKKSLKAFVSENRDGYDVSTLMRVVELSNARRDENAAFYTNKFLINEIYNNLPDFSQNELRIIEPSVGAGGFLPAIFKKYESVPKVSIDVVDIDPVSIDLLKVLLAKMEVPANFEINIICADFIMLDTPHHYDLAIGNPPFSRLKNSEILNLALANNVNKETKSLAEFFLEKCIRCSDYVAIVLNKAMLSTDEFSSTRQWLKKMRIDKILDFGRKGFTGVSIETMCLMIQPKRKPLRTFVYNMKFNSRSIQKQSYITDDRYPYFIIYRDQLFDDVAEKLQFNVFEVFRDRQITKSNTSHECTKESVWVIKGRNLNDDGSGVTHIPGYDAYINKSVVEKLSVSKFINNRNVYITPNMTYKPRVLRNIDNTVVDGSVAILIPKEKVTLSEKQRLYFSTKEYRRFYEIARNLSTQSINVDKTSVFFYGVLKNEC